MPSFDAMATINYTLRQWLTYYKNIWMRNLAASITDVAVDSAAVAVDPKAITPSLQENMVRDPFGNVVVEGNPKDPQPIFKTYAERLEERKAQAQLANRIIAGIDTLLSKTDDELTALAASDSDFLKAVTGEAAPAEAAAPAAADAKLVSFTVTAGHSVKTDDEVVHAENTTVDLDPEAEQTKQLVTDGAIVPTTAI